MHGVRTLVSSEADIERCWKITSGSHSFTRGNVARVGILPFLSRLGRAQPLLSCSEGRSEGGW